jgi:hypothetical protein
MGEMVGVRGTGEQLEVVPLLAALLSVPLPEGRYPPLHLSPQQQRQRTLDALVAWLLAEAEQQPVLNRSTRDWYTQPAAAMGCSRVIFATAAVTTGS